MQVYLGLGAIILFIICLIDLPFTKRYNQSLYGYFLRNGDLKLPGFVPAILSANLSIGNFIIFIASWGYIFGWGGIFWFIINLLLNTVAYIVFIPAFKKYIENKQNCGTIHEFLSSTFASSDKDKTFATKIRLVASATTIFGLLLAIVFEIHLASILLGPLLGINIPLIFSILTVLICIYSGVGGFHTLIFTDIMQSIAMIIGTAAIIPVLTIFGSFDQVMKFYPPNLHALNIGWPSILGICIIGSGWFLVAMDQWQRTCAMRDSRRTKIGMIWYFASISLFAIVYALMGMYDHASLLPALNSTLAAQHTGGNNPMVDFFLIAKIAPAIHPFLFALVGIAFLAAAMSTANTFLIVCGHSFVSDLLLTISNKKGIHSLTIEQERAYLAIARATVTGMGIFVIIAWFIFSITGLLKDPLSFFFIAYSIQFALLAPMVFSRLSQRFQPSGQGVFNSIRVGVLISVTSGVSFWILSQHNIGPILGLKPFDWLSLTPVITLFAGTIVLMCSKRKGGLL